MIKKNKIQVFCVSFITIWALSPPLIYGWAYRIICIFCLLLWSLLELSYQESIFKKPSYLTLGTLFYLLYTVSIEFFVKDEFSVINYFQVYIFMSFILFHEAHKKRGIEAFRTLFWLVLLLLPVWSGITIYHLYDNPKVARSIVRSNEIARQLSSKGVGGYGYVYSVLFVIPICVEIFRKEVLFTSKKWKKHLFRKFWSVKILLLAANIISGIWLILLAAYSFALMLLALSIGILFFYRKGKRIRNILFLILGGIVFFQTPLLINKYSKELQTLTIGTNYYTKVKDISQSVSSGVVSGAVEGRQERYQRSIKAFVTHPLMGTLSKDDLGKHSFLLDIFAQYGIFIGSVLVYILVKKPLFFLKQNIKFSSLSITMLIVLLMLTIINNIASGQGAIIFIIFPVALSYLSHNDIYQKIK